jgi:predicted nucleic acid-binding Zn ribbon protein
MKRRRHFGKTVGPQPITRSLSKALEQLTPRSAPNPTNTVSLFNVLFTQWETLVGTIAQHAHPVRIDGKTLVVAVDHPMWATAFRSVSEPLFSRLKEIEPGAPSQLHIVVRPPGKSP